MTHEISVTLVCPDVEVLDGDLIPLADYIASRVVTPNYIVGNFIDVTSDGINFSARYLNSTARDEIAALIAAVKPYAVKGLVTVHDCYHDVGASCGAVTELERWGEWA